MEINAKRRFLLFATICLVIVSLFSCIEIIDDGDNDGDNDDNGGNNNPTTVTDVNGNTYSFVKIGSQTWMTKNLAATSYNDGSPIQYVPDANEWLTIDAPAYCWYDNNYNVYGKVYGALYNGYAARTGKLCPQGWHVPSAQEWETLVNYLGGSTVAGGKLKETGTTHWLSPNNGATNESGFTALPGGVKYNGTNGYSIGYVGYFWTTTPGTYPTFSRTFLIHNQYTQVYNNDYDNGYGFSVRCIKN